MRQSLSIAAFQGALALGVCGCGTSVTNRKVPLTAFDSVDSPQRALTIDGTGLRWPLAPEADPVLISMPKSAQQSIASVGEYLRSHVADHLMLVRSLHEWVASRIRYEDHDDGSQAPTAIPPPRFDPPMASASDSAELLSRLFSRSDGPPMALPALLQRDATSGLADETFADKNGVCAGYAALLEKLGEHAGVNIKFVVGSARTSGDDGIEEGKHAWNVAEIDGRYYMIDATWDAGSGAGNRFKRDYKTDYLFTPPDIFAMSHFPDDSADLHTSHPLASYDFHARPLMAPSFYALGMRLDAGGSKMTEHGIHVVIDDPFEKELSAEVHSASGVLRCKVTSGRKSALDCPMGPGSTVLHIWVWESHHARLLATIGLPINVQP